MPLLGEMAGLEDRQKPDSDEGKEDLAELEASLNRARGRFELAQRVHDADSKRAYQGRKPQNKVVVKEYWDAYKVYDTLAAELGWKRAKLSAPASSSSSDGESSSNVQSPNRFNRGFRGRP